MGKVLFVLVIVVVLAIAVTWAVGEIAGRIDERRRKNAKWIPVPHTENGVQQILLERDGSAPVLIYPTPGTEHLTYDMAMIDAESTAMEWNRIQRELAR
jgi:hypothetical protein